MSFLAFAVEKASDGVSKKPSHQEAFNSLPFLTSVLAQVGQQEAVDPDNQTPEDGIVAKVYPVVTEPPVKLRLVPSAGEDGR